MTTTLSKEALSVIDAYLHFKVGSAVSSVPYFNNKTTRARAALRATVGKGSPKDLYDEVHSLIVKEHIPEQSLADESLKKIMADHNLGIDCSGFAFYILAAECEARGKGSLEKHIDFVNCRGLVGKVRAMMRPVENCDVATLAANSNSKVVTLLNVAPGDMITMINDKEESERDHILIVHEVTRPTDSSQKISFSHAVAYPEDGVYGTGIKQGTIEISDVNRSLTDSLWTESGDTKHAERIFTRAKKSRTELRRLNIFSA